MFHYFTRSLTYRNPTRSLMTVFQKRALDTQSSPASQTKKAKQITDFFKSSKPKTPAENKDELKEDIQLEIPKEAFASQEYHDTFDYTTLSQFKKDFISKLTPEQRELLHLELTTLEDSWFESLSSEFTKPYFLKLKAYIKSQLSSKKIFPPKQDIYSWSRLTPLSSVKVVILGQDPYHNDNQAHGLAFSVRAPTPPPPSLKNIYKAIQIDYPSFKIPDGRVQKDAGDLTKWAEQGVLMLNACLTVEAHKANSHAKQGWEEFTSAVLKHLLEKSENKLVLLLWGTPAQNRVKGLKLDEERIKVIKCVHPSPLSARRGFFEAECFKGCNDLLKELGESEIEWGLMEDNKLLE